MNITIMWSIWHEAQGCLTKTVSILIQQTLDSYLPEKYNGNNTKHREMITSLSNGMKLIIAKSERKSREWLPLWLHAADCAKVMEYLLHSRYPSIADICGIPFGELKKTAVLLAYLHDIGKITPFFQAKILQSLPDRRSIFEHYGIHIPDLSEYIHKERETSHHTICGEAILNKLGFPKDISSIVGAHHGMTTENVRGLTEKYPEKFFGIPEDSNLWSSLYGEWADHSLEHAGFCSASDLPKLNKRTQVLLSGMLVMSDWLSSDSERFVLIGEDEIFSENEYITGRFENAVDDLDLPDVWKSDQLRMTDEDFRERFSFSMNDIQSAVIKATESCNSPGLFILEAPMGIGKTEAALAVAEIFAARCEKTGVFFGLPTQATANGIFGRVVNWAEKQSSDAFHSIVLAHGSAEFNSEFIKLRSRDPQIDSDGEGGVVTHSFFSGSKQSLLADFAVGTVDRLLLSALKKKHAMLLHLGLSQKVAIVDECHAYDAYMNRYLDRALTWLHEYNVPVFLLSATLPEERRKTLINAYLNRSEQAAELPEVAYPRLTYTDGDELCAVPLPINIPEKTVRIAGVEDDAAIEEIRRAVGAGACVGIICNTVKRAQRFAELARSVEGANVILYHAQFVIPDRIEKEEALKAAVGKSSLPAQRNGTIIVGTQVLEQSLDIDFDVMMTDLCPMDLMLQRIGRLHRHERADRPNDYKNARCIVFGTTEPNRSSEKIYTKWLLMRTRKLLPETISVPGDIDRLVTETYKDAEPDGSEERAALEEYTLKLAIKQQKAEAYLMSSPREGRRSNDLHGWLNNSVSDNENKALATVRDGMSSIEVIVMVRYPDGMLGLLPRQSDGGKYSPETCPPESVCEQIARQRLRLPAVFCYDADMTIDELEKADKHLVGFQSSHWLKGELVLLLNEKLTADLCGYKISYSHDNGLEYKKEE